MVGRDFPWVLLKGSDCCSRVGLELGSPCLFAKLPAAAVGLAQGARTSPALPGWS